MGQRSFLKNLPAVRASYNLFALLNGTMRKVLTRKVLNLKIGLRVVLTAYCRRKE